MERNFQKDALVRSGPMGPFREITALIQGTPTADFHGGENAARLNAGKRQESAKTPNENVFQKIIKPELGFKCLSLKKSIICI